MATRNITIVLTDQESALLDAAFGYELMDVTRNALMSAAASALRRKIDMAHDSRRALNDRRKRLRVA